MIIACLEFLLETLKYWVGVQWGQQYFIGEGTSLALVGNPFSDAFFTRKVGVGRKVKVRTTVFISWQITFRLLSFVQATN